MANDKVTFKGFDGSDLAGIVETPDLGEPIAWVLYAHCFTCGKDVAAASRIARALSMRGFGVLRFDFTGLGKSEGDFADTNFSTNVRDLHLAEAFLREHYDAPQILIGHSLGGTAALAAGRQMESCKAIATIGSPFDPEHVTKQFGDHIEEIESAGQADVELAGRPFVIKKQFLDDVRDASIEDDVAHLRKALLVFHSPIDASVSINEAEKIYLTAKHPKSFVSLDTADHLLTSKTDAEYVATTVAGWASRYIEPHVSDVEVSGGEVFVGEADKKFARTVQTDSHAWISDEPKAMGGRDRGPDPYEQLLAALGTCTSMTIRMYANRKQLPLEDVSVLLKHNRDYFSDCEDCDEKLRQIETLSREISFQGDLTDEEQARLMEIADRCPVHKTLLGELEITSTQVTAIGT